MGGNRTGHTSQVCAIPTNRCNSLLWGEWHPAFAVQEYVALLEADCKLLFFCFWPKTAKKYYILVGLNRNKNEKDNPFRPKMKKMK